MTDALFHRSSRNVRAVCVLQVMLPVGVGKVKVEVPSRCVSMSRPFVHFHFEVAPEMFYENMEWVRVEAEKVGVRAPWGGYQTQVKTQ